MNIFKAADIMLPEAQDLYRWAVIACDQFTSDAAYWQRVRQAAEGYASTVHMILPEAELEGERRSKVEAINRTMEEYLANGVFKTYSNAYVYVERTLQDGSVRPGLVGAVDLEAYDYNPGSESPVRATEKTVLERIPPRKEVRRDAPLELPHVLMLCDDDGKCLIEPISAIKEQLPLLYDFDLMEGGGHIRGYLLQGKFAEDFDNRFAAYSQVYGEKYPDLDGAKVLLAVGDGNHSLATAKSCYEELKRNNPGMDFSNHPARYALVELENIHDESLKFEPIHRILTGVDTGKLLAWLEGFCAEEGFCVPYVMGSVTGELILDSKKGELAVAVLQKAIDDFLAENPGEIDYIHGDKEVAILAQQDNAIGFLLPAMGKGQLFRGVISGGVLPRKTFSMGHAREKRYYLEGRKIR
ncbi:MAG: DUF1015 domain-containing protein [Oscillospiraceae bacterium]|nr:DUF1015 domain-containing protein [Oscillospiraceae bacterium]